jgi:predicted transcriptional regulator
MHYNKFTIDYIESIKRNLKIEVNEFGEATYFPDIVTDCDILNLKKELQVIWENSTSAIDVIRTKQESMIQSGLFGIINEFDTALKIGFLMSDRIVLIDYLFERLLKKKEPNKIDRIHIGVISNSLVEVLPLAQKGRIVIIPSPFYWYPETKRIIGEIASKITISPSLMSLLNMLSITKYCKLHPYTIAESEKNYSLIIDSQIDYDMIGKDGGNYAYESILGALLSEKLLNEIELKIALNIPLSKYFEIITSNKDFYLKYLTEITRGGSINAQSNINRIRDALVKEIEEKNKIDFRNLAKGATIASSIGSAVIAAVSTITAVSAPLLIIGSLLRLSATLTGLVNNNKKNEDIIISVFKKLYDN